MKEKGIRNYSSNKTKEDSPCEIIQAHDFSHQFKRPSITPFSKFEDIYEEEHSHSSIPEPEKQPISHAPAVSYRDRNPENSSFMNDIGDRDENIAQSEEK